MKRSRLLGSLAVVALAVALAGGVPASAAPPRDQGAPAMGADLRLLQVRDSLLARHLTYEQVYSGVPVLGGYYVLHVRHDGSTSVADGRIPVSAPVSVVAGVDQSDANRTAIARVGGVLTTSLLAVLPGSPPRLVWAVQNADSQRVLVDAVSGAVIRVDSQIRQATGRGLVFDPNPVVALQDETLTDDRDANSAVPASAYRRVPLRHLDGSGYLRGSYAEVVLPVEKLAFSATNSFNYGRANDYFEQVESYYAVDSAQTYFQSLGFIDVNNEPQGLKPNGTTADNSFYSPNSDLITLGSGGVDDGEDPEVIWHELGHAVQDDQVPGFGSSTQAGAIGEGFGDYLALTMSQATSEDTEVTPWACIMDWDATSYTTGEPHCLRRADTDKHYPEDLVGEVHDDGEIWSAALYDINRVIGRERADTAILEGQFSFAPGTSMPAAAGHVVAATRALYGPTAAGAVQRVFEQRGIL
ncbi:MAG: M36 family metallopeptidase [Geodermatophilaceae bacterium]|nr:M36 family metallopeptidase [Geodermatophilaceae bacterium]